MFKILIMNQLKQTEVVNLPAIPRVGDTVPLFYNPAPKVTIVCFLPEKLMPELEGKNIDAVVCVE